MGHCDPPDTPGAQAAGTLVIVALLCGILWLVGSGLWVVWQYLAG